MNNCSTNANISATEVHGTPPNQETLRQAISVYKDTYGEPQYRYFKVIAVWSKPRGKPGYHFSPVGEGDEITKEEYEANIETSILFRREAFIGRLPRTYWQYSRKIAVDGWMEHLIADVKKIGEMS